VGVGFLALVGLEGRGSLLGFYLLFPAIFASSVLFSRGTGIFAVTLSCLLLYLFLKPAGSMLLAGEYVFPLVFFGLLAVGLAIVSEALRTAWEHAVNAERAKDLLLRELGHRTKNNLAMVISVLSLQARSKTNPETRDALEKAVARVRAIASAHEHFQPAKQNGRVEMRSYLEGLCGHLGDSLRDVRPIAVEVDSDDVHLRTEQAVPLGLIVNELVTNALKHAFPDDRSGAVRVVLRNTNSLALTVEDNGVGCPRGRHERLGSRLTRLLAEQLKAKLAWEEAGPGCRICVEFFPNYPIAGTPNGCAGRDSAPSVGNIHHLDDTHLSTQESLFLFTKPSGNLACFACPDARR
jgi:two-component sensor histidine kinase